MSGAVAAVVSGGRWPTGVQGGASVGAAGVWTLNSDGSASYCQSPGAGVWLSANGTGIGAGYKVRVDVTAGVFESGTTGSDLALSSAQTWQKTNPGTVTFNCTIKDAAGNTLRAFNGLTVTVS